MKNLTLVAALAFVLTLPAHGQVLSNDILMYIDIPATSDIPQGPPVWITGWAFSCFGRSVSEITLWRYDQSVGNYVRVPTVRYTGLYRPDVAAAFTGKPNCATTDYSGWALYPTIPIPNGVQALRVYALESGEVEFQVRFVIVK